MGFIAKLIVRQKLDLLSQCLLEEYRMYHRYSQQQRFVNNEEIRKRIEMLAESEERHIKKLEEKIKKLKGLPLGEESFRLGDKTMGEMFSVNFLSERRLCSLYERLIEGSKDKETKNVLLEILKDEKVHLEELEEMYRKWS